MTAAVGEADSTLNQRAAGRRGEPALRRRRTMRCGWRGSGGESRSEPSGRLTPSHSIRQSPAAELSPGPRTYATANPAGASHAQRSARSLRRSCEGWGGG